MTIVAMETHYRIHPNPAKLSRRLSLRLCLRPCSLSPVSTARFAGVVAMNGGSPPQNRRTASFFGNLVVSGKRQATCATMPHSSEMH